LDKAFPAYNASGVIFGVPTLGDAAHMDEWVNVSGVKGCAIIVWELGW